MKVAHIWTICWLVVISGNFGASKSVTAQSTLGINSTGGGLQGPAYPPKCLPPTDDFPSTEFTPKKIFYDLGDTIFYQCRDRLSTLSRGDKRVCLALPGAFVGFWTYPIPVCFRKCNTFSCNYCVGFVFKNTIQINFINFM